MANAKKTCVHLARFFLYSLHLTEKEAALSYHSIGVNLYTFGVALGPQ